MTSLEIRQECSLCPPVPAPRASSGARLNGPQLTRVGGITDSYYELVSKYETAEKIGKSGKRLGDCEP